MAVLGEVISTTLFDQAEETADEIVRHTPLLSKLKEKGNIRLFKGGYEIRKAVAYQDSYQGGFYTGYEVFDMSGINDLDAFQFPVRQCYEPFAISGRDMRANSDKERLIDLVDEKMKAVKSRLTNNVSESTLGDGTRYGGREFTGISAAISTAPSTGSYGTIDRVANLWARNLAVSSGGLTAGNIQQFITTTMIQITRGTEAPDLAIATRANWQLLHGTLTAIQRINDQSSTGKGGYKSIFFNGCEFIFDGGFAGTTGAPVLASGIRFLNTKYWTMDIERQANFMPLSKELERPVDQDGYYNVIIVEGNLCCSAPMLQAVLT